MPTFRFDTELVRRHDVNGPRYTSYPTADRFRDGRWITDYEAALASTDLQALSLYLHVPFCSTICYYCACNKIITANRKRAESYVQHLIHEMSLHRRLIDDSHSVEQLHFGGGTPTFLNDDQISWLFEAMRTYFNLADDDSRDFSIEIDPRAVNPERIIRLAKCSISRLSVGVQDSTLQYSLLSIAYSPSKKHERESRLWQFPQAIRAPNWYRSVSAAGRKWLCHNNQRSSDQLATLCLYHQISGSVIRFDDSSEMLVDNKPVD